MLFVVTYNTKYKTYITMSKSSTISLDVLNALSPQKGMLNASVKELENQVFTFHSIVAPAEKTADLTAVSDDNSYVKARYINSKQRRVS
jgi:hypothetical protein